MAGQCATRHPEHELGDGSDVPLPKFQAFVASGRWAAAAEECKFNLDEGTIRYRNKLDRMYFLLAQKVADQHLPVEYLVIALDSVLAVQHGLWMLGYNPGPQDGGDGPKTQAGVRVLPDRRGSAGQRRLE